MRFKKIYIEITNKCNLNCSFCSIKDKEKKNKEMTTLEFDTVINKIKDYTNYVYLHILGEPLLHSDLREILNICKKYNIKVNITTNGVFLKEKINDILASNIVRQINISLHSENNKPNYLADILNSVGNIKDIIINYRFWTSSNKKLSPKMYDYLTRICNYYNKDINKINNTINDNTFISIEDKFIWPNINNNYYKESGYCLGLKNQLGILSDGTVVICCLDSNGLSNLGNILKNDLDTILNSEKTNLIIKNFNNRYAYLEICKHCSFKERFDK